MADGDAPPPGVPGCGPEKLGGAEPDVGADADPMNIGITILATPIKPTAAAGAAAISNVSISSSNAGFLVVVAKMKEF